jgi:hypothetical protein
MIIWFVLLLFVQLVQRYLRDAASLSTAMFNVINEYEHDPMFNYEGFHAVIWLIFLSVFDVNLNCFN